MHTSKMYMEEQHLLQAVEETARRSHLQRSRLARCLAGYQGDGCPDFVLRVSWAISKKHDIYNPYYARQGAARLLAVMVRSWLGEDVRMEDGTRATLPQALVASSVPSKLLFELMDASADVRSFKAITLFERTQPHVEPFEIMALVSFPDSVMSSYQDLLTSEVLSDET